MLKKNLLMFGSAFALAIVLALSVAAQQLCSEEGSIRSVTKARSGNFETVTFEIAGKGIPAVEITDEKPPIENYGGENLHMKGRAFKGVRMQGVNWTCMIRENFGARTSTIKDIKNSEQFEGYVTYVIGYSARSKYVGKTEIKGTKTSKIIVKFRR